MAKENGRPSLRVLIIDDNVDDVIMMMRVIEKSYHTVWQRADNEAGLMVALRDEETWDIIICDYKMPILSPERVFEVLAEERVSTPVIIVSGSVNEDVAIDMMKKGARDFISKPNWGRLVLVIERELRSRSERSKDRKQVEEAFDQTIEAWGKALELRDKYTHGHTERVTTLSLRLGRAMNISHEQFIALHKGALLHDIGKMAIPDAILLKRDVLTVEEMEIMKTHPIIARNMLNGISFLQDVIDIPYLHHERWNGTGYPLGLKGEAIPFLARLFAVVDVYDSLTTDRPYRPSWDKSKAIAYIIEESGKTFDPSVVDAFVNLVGRG